MMINATIKRTRYALATAAAACLLLAACAGRPTPSPAPPTAPTPPLPPSAAPPAPVMPPPAPEPVVFSLTSFIGGTPDAVRDRFGAPTLTRQEGTAEVWQYERGACVLHFYIYPTGNGGRNVTFAEARTVPGARGIPPLAETCLKAFGRTP